MSASRRRPPARWMICGVVVLALGLLGALAAGCGVKAPPRPPTPASLCR
jgi:hypothetical protein